MPGRIMVATRPLLAGMLSSQIVVAGLLVAVLLSAGPLAGYAGAVRLQDSGILSGGVVKSFEANLSSAETSHNTTLFIPINASARITQAQLNVSGRFEVPFINLSGRGTALASGEEYGGGVHGGGDYNNDGFDDLAIGAFAENSAGDAPRVDVFWGSSTGIRGRTANWSYAGPTSSGFGWALADGDYDHDGIDDLVVGGSDFFAGIALESVYVFYGSASGLPASPSLQLVLNTSTIYSWGWSLAGNLDLDNDTYDDLVVAEAFNLSNQGTVWVLWGGPSGLNVSDSSELTGFNTLDRFNSFSEGIILESLGDTDNDGYDEFAAGTAATNNSFGSAEVWEGGPARSLTQVWSYGMGSNSFFGWSVAGGRDITGDGIADLVVGAPVDPTNTGAVYVFNGAGDATYASAPSTRLQPVVNTTAEQFGAAVEMLKDFDGDSKSELVVGGNLPDGNDGRVYIYRAHNLSTAGALLIRPNATGGAEQMGFTLSTGGDINGDGKTDLAVQLRSGINGTSRPGAVRAFYGSAYFYPEAVKIFVNQTLVRQFTGPFVGNTTVSALGPALQGYLENHTADANATGFVWIPVSFNFSLGGRLNVSELVVGYSVVLPPRNVTLSAPAIGGSLVISWSLQPTDGTVFSIWSNKSGVWAVVANVSVPRSSYNDTNVSDGVPYWYYVTEWDPSVGLQSAASAVVTGVPADIVAPAVPINLTVLVNETTHSANISWVPNGDDTVRYEVWRKDGDAGVFVLYSNVSAPAFRFTDTGLLEEVNYSYRVRAVDDAGLMSAFGGTVLAYVRDMTPPATPVNLRGLAEPSGTAISLAWDLNTDDTVAYAVVRSTSNLPGSFVEIARSPTGAFTDSGLTRNRTYYFQLEAIDKVNLHSPATGAIAVLTVDAMAPDAPVLVGAVPLVSGNTVQLDWTATGDDLAGFKVYTDASGLWAEVAQVGGTSRTAVVTSLTDGVAVDFRVAAFDLGGLLGAPSNTISATPRDTQRPSAPPSLATASPPQGASLVLTWASPTDSDIAGFRVYFLDPTTSADYILIATVGASTLAYTHAGLSNGVTYSYQVTALDEVPNESPPSPRSVGIPRDLIAPAAPRIAEPAAITNQVNFLISGTSEPNLVVEVWVNGAARGNTTADTTGKFTLTAPLRKGVNEVYVRAIDPSPLVDPAYRVSPNSASVHVTVDTDKPTVLTIVPPQGLADADPSTVVSITFSEPVDFSSVQLTLTDSQGNPVAGAVEYDNLTHVARFTPASPLLSGTRYDVAVGARDLAGNALAPATYSFTTKAAGGGGGVGGFIPGFEAGLVASALGLAFVALVSRRRQ